MHMTLSRAPALLHIRVSGVSAQPDIGSGHCPIETPAVHANVLLRRMRAVQSHGAGTRGGKPFLTSCLVNTPALAGRDCNLAPLHAGSGARS